MKIQGKLHDILDIQSGISKNGNEWQKQPILIDTEAKFNNIIAIDLFGETIEKIQNLQIGAFVEVKLNISSKEYNGRYYTNISAWDISLVEKVESEESEMPF